MKRASFLLLAGLMILTLSVPGPALAQSSSPTWNSTIYYYNPRPSAGSMGVTFANSGMGATPDDIPGVQVPSHAFGQVLVGSTGDYTGAATLSADIPLVAVYKQYDAAGGAYAPVLYSSFDAAQSGTTGKFYVPSLRHDDNYVSRVGIQNVETEPVDLTLDFYGANGSKTVSLSKPLASQGSFIFQAIDDASNVPGLVLRSTAHWSSAQLKPTGGHLPAWWLPLKISSRKGSVHTPMKAAARLPKPSICLTPTAAIPPTSNRPHFTSRMPAKPLPPSIFTITLPAEPESRVTFQPGR